MPLTPEEIVPMLRARAAKITDDLPDVVAGFDAACELADLYTAAANLIDRQARKIRTHEVTIDTVRKYLIKPPDRKGLDWPPRPLLRHSYAPADINRGYDLPCCDMPGYDAIHDC